MDEVVIHYVPDYWANDIDGNGQGNAGACPPIRIEYRIYAEIDFDKYFGNPPPTVITG